MKPHPSKTLFSRAPQPAKFAPPACPRSVLADFVPQAKPSEAPAVHIMKADAARPLLDKNWRRCLQPGSIVFFLHGGAHFALSRARPAPLGFCIASPCPPARTGQKPAPQMRFQDSNILSAAEEPALEIAALHIAAASEAARGKALLLRAVADYCREKHIAYIFGRFSTAGKYPASYPRAFSRLYQRGCRVLPAIAAPRHAEPRFAAPLLRYCLRLGARADMAEETGFDHSKVTKIGFAALPQKPQAEKQKAKPPMPAAATAA